jgi:hypothetical protein
LLKEKRMFGKKQPKAPWAVQLLTNDYLVSGHLDGDDPTGPWFLQVQASDLAMATLTLTDAGVEPAAGQTIQATRVAKWVLPATGLWVGVLPRDDGSLAYCTDQNSNSKHPIPATAYVGAYEIRGTVLSPDKYVDILAGYPSFAMQNVTINSLAPGARVKDFQAPYIVLRTLLLQGIVPA